MTDTTMHPRSAAVVGVRIPFIRKFPVGPDKMQMIDRPAPIARMAKAILDDGARLMIAVHSEERVQITCARLPREADGSASLSAGLEVLAERECANGPALPLAIDEVVRAAYEKLD